MGTAHTCGANRARTAQSRAANTLGLAASAVVLAGGVALIQAGAATRTPPAPSAADALPTQMGSHTSPAPALPPPAGVRPLPPSPPVRIKIPVIGVDAPVVGETLDGNGAIQTPPNTDRDLAGWYRDGPAPGTAGNAIMLGHVDTTKGPAVFYNLGALHKHQTIDILRADHTTAVFTIDAINVYADNDFPSTTVYGPTTTPQLRLITCGGGYNRHTGYLGNVVVYAHLTTTTPPDPSGQSPA